MRFCRASLLVVGLCVGALSEAQEFPFSQEPVSLAAYKFTAPPKLDGTIGAEEWSGASTVARSLVIGGTNQDSGEKGQVWIGYDEKYLYIAARILLQEPEKISADEFRDNVSLNGNDSFTFEFSTFGMTQDGNTVTFNANGATSLEIEGGRAAKVEWSGRIEAIAKATPTGWEGELRIPWALLPLPKPGIHDMKLLYGWYVSASGRQVTSHARNDDPNKVHSLTGVDVPATPGSHRMLMLPYAYGGYNDETKGLIANAGLDVKSAVTQDMNLVATFNPDFRNIEGDILNLDFSNFERLANETRPFFQEGNDYYFFGMGRSIFASQRLQSFDMGLNVYGNLGGRTRLGLISTVDIGHQETLAGSYTYNPDQYAEYSFSFASLQKVGEDNNAGRINLSRRSGKWLGFVESNVTSDQIEGSGSANLAGAFYNETGWDGGISYVDVTSGFFPRIGFVPERDFRGFRGSLTHETEYTAGAVNRTEYGIEGFEYTRRDGSHYRDGGQLSAEVSMKSLIQASTELDYEHFEDRHDKLASLSLEYPYTNPYRRFNVGASYGEIEGASYRLVEGGFRYRPIKRLQLSLRAQSVQHTVNEDQIVLDFNFEKGKYESFGGRVVYNEHEWNWFASYRMSGNTGAEYFLIVGDPNASSFQKTLILKVTVPFTIGG